MMHGEVRLRADVMETLKELDDGTFFRELIQLFLDHTPPLIETLEEAYRRGDRLASHSAAHKLKGSCANIGAEVLAELASRLEPKQQVQALPIEDALSIISRLRNEFSWVKNALMLEVENQQARPWNQTPISY